MMNPRMVLFAALALVASTAFAAEFVPGEVIVKYRSVAKRERKSVNMMYEHAGVIQVKRFNGMMSGFEKLTIRDTIKVQDAIAELMANEEVEYAQPNFVLRALPIEAAKDEPLPCVPGYDVPGCGPTVQVPCIIPGLPFPPGCEDGGNPGQPGNPTPPATRPPVADAPADVNPPMADPRLSDAYGIGKIGAPEAWTNWRGSKQMIVAVIDTGIDYNHEDLAFNVWRNPNPTNGDIAGYDFVHNDGLPFDDHSHGTHTSGTVGAVGGNGKGVSGVNQRVSIMGLKFLSAEGSGSTADAIRAIDYAVDHGAKVLSNSWGGKGDDGNRALFDAIDRAKAKDVLFIAAAGNDGTDNDAANPSYPAGFDNDNLISVAATDRNDRLAYFSNFGKRTTHLAAPGVGVLSTVAGGGYKSMDGTSMACPHVAGAAALVWSKNPTWTYKQVKNALMSSVDLVPSLASKTVTGGRLNVLKALHSME